MTLFHRNTRRTITTPSIIFTRYQNKLRRPHKKLYHKKKTKNKIIHNNLNKIASEFTKGEKILKLYIHDWNWIVNICYRKIQQLRAIHEKRPVLQ